MVNYKILGEDIYRVESNPVTQIEVLKFNSYVEYFIQMKKTLVVNATNILNRNNNDRLNIEQSKRILKVLDEIANDNELNKVNLYFSAYKNFHKNLNLENLGYKEDRMGGLIKKLK